MKGLVIHVPLLWIEYLMLDIQCQEEGSCGAFSITCAFASTFSTKFLICLITWLWLRVLDSNEHALRRTRSNECHFCQTSLTDILFSTRNTSLYVPCLAFSDPFPLPPPWLTGLIHQAITPLLQPEMAWPLSQQLETCINLEKYLT